MTTRGLCQVDDTFRFAFILGGEESQGDPTQQRALDDQGTTEPIQRGQDPCLLGSFGNFGNEAK